MGLPPSLGASVTSGWDIKDFRFFYDPGDDSLYVGINFFGIAGDADGDGNPSSASAALTALGGQDVANLALSEAIQIEFDWNGDGVFDTIAGVPANTPTPPLPKPFLIAPDLLPGTQLPADSTRFGTPVPGPYGFVGASVTAPDFEFKIPNVSTLPGFDVANGFEFRAYAGSFQDDGIGEDFTQGVLHVDLPTPAPEPVTPPVVALTELIVSRSSFNFWGTAAGEDGIARVEYKTDQKHWRNFLPANGTTSWRFKIRRDGYQSLRVVIRAVDNEGNASSEMVVEIQP